MKCKSFETIVSTFDKNVINLDQAKKDGKKVVGQYCLYTPSEIALAAGGIPVSLCGTKNDSIAAAEEVLPRTLCPLIKSSFGFELLDSCPYLSASDIVIADSTCDGKKKMYEFLGERKPLMLLQLPQRQDERALAYWEDELRLYVKRLEEDFNVEITEEKLRQAILFMNRKRRALKSVMDLAQRKPSPITGMELLEIGFKASFLVDKEFAVTSLEAVAKEIGERADAGEVCYKENTPRILLTGVPVGMGSHKVITLIEQSGGNVVCLDNCSGYKKARIKVDENVDPIHALAKAYLDIPCAVMSPNPHRYDALKEMCADFKVDAVIDLTWHGCQTYETESSRIKKFVREELALPFLHIESDYADADTEQLKVRIEAFLEML